MKNLIIAITGSAGKTTTKEMIASILNKRWQILKSKNNNNLHTHTARYADELKPSHHAAVLEYGLLLPGDIAEHCRALQPDFGIITNVGTAHIGSFRGSIARIAKAKSELILGMKSTGKLFINADDTYSKLLLTNTFKGKIITIGAHNPAHYRAQHIKYTNQGMSFRVALDGKIQQFQIPIFGEHNIYNALFAIAVSHTVGISADEMISGLNTFIRPKRRLMVYPQGKGITIIDDTFSANPQAVKAAIEVLHHIGSRAKIAVLASMLELGNYSIAAHREIGGYLAQHKINYLYTFGKEAIQIGEGAIASGFPQNRLLHCTTKEALHRQLTQTVKPYTTILVKGSHKLKMNQTVLFLRDHFKA